MLFNLKHKKAPGFDLLTLLLVTQRSVKNLKTSFVRYNSTHTMLSAQQRFCAKPINNFDKRSYSTLTHKNFIGLKSLRFFSMVPASKHGKKVTTLKKVIVSRPTAFTVFPSAPNGVDASGTPFQDPAPDPENSTRRYRTFYGDLTNKDYVKGGKLRCKYQLVICTEPKVKVRKRAGPGWLDITVCALRSQRQKDKKTFLVGRKAVALKFPAKEQFLTIKSSKLRSSILLSKPIPKTAIQQCTLLREKVLTVIRSKKQSLNKDFLLSQLGDSFVGGEWSVGIRARVLKKRSLKRVQYNGENKFFIARTKEWRLQHAKKAVWITNRRFAIKTQRLQNLKTRQKNLVVYKKIAEQAPIIFNQRARFIPQMQHPRRANKKEYELIVIASNSINTLRRGVTVNSKSLKGTVPTLGRTLHSAPFSGRSSVETDYTRLRAKRFYSSSARSRSKQKFAFTTDSMKALADKKKIAFLDCISTPVVITEENYQNNLAPAILVNSTTFTAAKAKTTRVAPWQTTPRSVRKGAVPEAPYGITGGGVIYRSPMQKNEHGKKFYRPYISLSPLLAELTVTNTEGNKATLSTGTGGNFSKEQNARPKDFRGNTISFYEPSNERSVKNIRFASQKEKRLVRSRYTSYLGITFETGPAPKPLHGLLVQPATTGFLVFQNELAFFSAVNVLVFKKLIGLTKYLEIRKHKNSRKHQLQKLKIQILNLLRWAWKKIEQGIFPGNFTRCQAWRKKILLHAMNCGAVEQKSVIKKASGKLYKSIYSVREQQKLLEERYQFRKGVSLAKIKKTQSRSAYTAKYYANYRQLSRRNFFRQKFSRKNNILLNKEQHTLVASTVKLENSCAQKKFLVATPAVSYARKLKRFRKRKPWYKRKKVQRRLREVRSIAKFLLARRRSLIWPTLRPQRFQFRYTGWKTGKRLKKRGKIVFARRSFRSSGHVLTRGQKRTNARKEQVLSRRQTNKNLPFHSLQYNLTSRKRHTPRDLGGRPYRRPEISPIELIRRNVVKESRHFKKQEYLRDAWRLKPGYARNLLLKKAQAKNLRPPVFPDLSWRELERQVGYPATVGYVYRRRTLRNNFITNRWWNPKPNSIATLHPFAVSKLKDQPQSYKTSPNLHLYNTSVTFFSSNLHERRRAGLLCATGAQPLKVSLLDAKHELQRILGKLTISYEKREPVWQMYLHNVNDDQRSPHFLKHKFDKINSRVFSAQNFDRALHRLPLKKWEAIIKSLGRKKIKDTLHASTSLQLRTAYIKQRRLESFSAIPTIWLDEANIRSAALKRTVEEINAERVAFAQKNGLSLQQRRGEITHHDKKQKVLLTKESTLRRQIWKTDTKRCEPLVLLLSRKNFLKRLIVNYKKLYTENTKQQKRVYQKACAVKEKLRVKEYQPDESLDIGQLRFSRWDDIQPTRADLLTLISSKLRNWPPLNSFFDLETKEIGTSYQLWAEGERLSQKNATLAYSSYEQDPEKDSMIYNLPFHRPRFPAAGNRYLSYSRALRVYYHKTRRPRFRRSTQLRYQIVRPQRNGNKKVISEHYGNSLTLRLKSKRAQRSVKAYLPKRWRILGQARTHSSKFSDKIYSSILSTGQHAYKVKRRFARAPRHTKYSAGKTYELARRPLWQITPKIHNYRVRKLAISRRTKVRAVADQKKAQRYRRLPVEQVFPTKIQRKKDKERIKLRKVRQNKWITPWYSRSKYNVWTWRGSYTPVLKTSKRPYAKFSVTQAGEKTLLASHITRAPWIKYAYNTNLTKRIHYVKTIIAKLAPRRSVLRTEFIQLEEPDHRNRRLIVVKRWERKGLAPFATRTNENRRLRERRAEWQLKKNTENNTRHSFLKKFRGQASVQSTWSHAESFPMPYNEDLNKISDWTSYPFLSYLVSSRLEWKEGSRRSLHAKPASARRRADSLRLGESKNFAIKKNTFFVSKKNRAILNFGQRSKLKKALHQTQQFTAVSKAIVKDYRNENAAQRTSQLLLNDSNRVPTFVPLTFRRKVKRLERSNTEIALKKKQQAELDFFTYRLTTEVAETTTSFFPQLRSWLIKRECSPDNRTEEYALSWIYKMYWSLRFYLCRDDLGSLLYTRDQSKQKRFDMREDLEGRAKKRYFTEVDRVTTRERRQTHWLTTKLDQKKASLGFLRIWFPRLYKFYLEDKHRFANLTFSPLEAYRVTPSGASWNQWETTDLKSNDDVAFKRRLRTEKGGDWSWYESRLKTTRRPNPTTPGSDPYKHLPRMIASSMSIRNNFFKKNYSTQARKIPSAFPFSTESDWWELEFLQETELYDDERKEIHDYQVEERSNMVTPSFWNTISRSELQDRQRAEMPKVYSQFEARRQHHTMKSGVVSRSVMSFIPPTAKVRAGALDIRYSRLKSPRNAQYLKRIGLETERKIDDRAKIYSKSMMRSTSQLNTPGSRGARQHPLFRKKTSEEKFAPLTYVRNRLLERRNPGFLRTRHMNNFRAAKKMIFCEVAEERPKTEKRILNEQKLFRVRTETETFDIAAKNFLRKLTIVDEDHNSRILNVPSILQSRTAFQRVSVIYEERMPISAYRRRILLNPWVASVSMQNRFLSRSWARTQKKRTAAERFREEKITGVTNASPLGKDELEKIVETKKLTLNDRSDYHLDQLRITIPMDTKHQLALFHGTASFHKKLQIFSGDQNDVPFVTHLIVDPGTFRPSPKTEFATPQNFHWVARQSQSIKLRHSVLYRSKIEVNRRNILVERRNEFWEFLTGEYYLKGRRLKNWVKDIKRFLIRSNWKEIPEVIFKDRRARLRLYEWHESDEHFHRQGWKNAFKLFPSERQLAPWLQPLRRRRTAYSTNHGEYRRYSFPREQKRQKERQYYRKARASNDSHRIYVKGRRWPRLRTTAYRMSRSLFEFRNTRAAQKHFIKNSKMKTQTTGFSRNIVGLGNRLDVTLILLGLFKTVFWARRYASYGILKVNDKLVVKSNYRLQPNDLIEFDWEKILQAQAAFQVYEPFHKRELVTRKFKLQTLPGNFRWHPNHRFLRYVRFPYPEDIADNTRLCRWRFDSFRMDAGIGRR